MELDLPHGVGADRTQGAHMSHILFRCPVSGQNVHRLIDDDAQADGKSYVIVDCPARAKLHFVNRSTHKLLGHERE